MARSSRGSRPPQESLAVGGQAVVEGVMMRNGDVIVTAVRTPSGRIRVKKEEYVSLTKRSRFLGLPFIRGIVGLVEILIIGMRSLLYSSQEAVGGDEEFSRWEVFFTVLFAVLFSLALFKVLPLFLASVFQEKVHGGNWLLNVVDGLLKIGLLVGYMWLIGFLKDTKRLFGYHGAEHKSIHCYEKGLPLTVKNVLAQSRFHPRCGTTFVLFVFFMSVAFYLFIPLGYSFWEKLVLRIALLPLIAGASYELIKIGGKYYQHPLMKVVLAPGMLLQRLTTREPDEKMVAVAIKSLKAAVGL